MENIRLDGEDLEPSELRDAMIRRKWKRMPKIKALLEWRQKSSLLNIEKMWIDEMDMMDMEDAALTDALITETSAQELEEDAKPDKRKAITDTV